MKRVAVFGNAGGGKSTLARRLAEVTRLPLYPLDTIQYQAGGGRVPHDDYLKAHADILRREAFLSRRYADLHGLATCHALLVGIEAADQRIVRNPGRLAR